ncbi:MAG: winged helix DNA-binding domain-containing protein, partial [Chloroflexi bacterium]|nr:winged helix DNA-binding domain-containing protein [Chloroflexota bacterium]
MSAPVRGHRTSGTLSIREARALALRAQSIRPHPLNATPSHLRSLLLQQGCVQLDSVSAVARAHELLPFSRLGPYDSASLRRLVYRERLMFEYWGHAMSWLPMAEFRYALPTMERFHAAPRRWWRDVRERHGDLYAAVVQRIRDEGPLPSSAFEDPRPGRDSWWDHKPAKLVLEDLFDQGVLMVSD